MTTVDELFRKYLDNKKSTIGPINDISQSKQYWVWGEIPEKFKPQGESEALKYYYKHCNDLPF